MMWFRRRIVRLYDRPREARLRPEYASFYRALKAGRWYPVRRLLKRIHWQPGSARRQILHAHFEFQGGLHPRNPAWPFLRQREDDEPVAAPAAVERQGRLLRVYAQHYRRIRPEQWLSARDLRDEVVELREQESQEKPAWQRESAALGRTLPDEHFEFRLGTSDPGMPRLRTRRDDPPFRQSIDYRKR